MFSKDEDNPDNFQIDAVVHIFPDDLDASDVDGDYISIIETPVQGIPPMDNPAINELDTLPVAQSRMQLMGLFGRRPARSNVRTNIVKTGTIHMYTLLATIYCISERFFY